MQRAFAELLLIGLAGGALGCWILFYGLSYNTESLTHALFPGLVFAVLLGLPLVLGGAIGLLIAAVAIAATGRVPEIGRDTAVAVVVTTLFGAGVLVALSSSTPPGIQELLFGDIFAVSNADLLLAAALVAVVLVGLRLLHGQLLAVGFDRSRAPTLGGRPMLVETAVLVLLALAILVAVQGLGNLLIVAVLVGPAATARLLVDRMPQMMLAATLLTVFVGASGLCLSYYAGTAGGASVAGVMVVVYLIVRGLLALSR